MSLTATAVRADAHQDQGPKKPSDVATVALVLRLQNGDALAQFIQDVTDPSSSSYHQFLSPAEFIARFSPTSSAVAAVTSHLKANGMSVIDVSSNRMIVHAQGTVDALNRYFATSIHDFVSDTRHYYAPVNGATVPAAISGTVASVVGLSTANVYRPHLARTPESKVTPASAAPTVYSAAQSSSAPGEYTTTDVANFYQVQPLYRRGFTGQGRTVGIATLASFDPADAYAYWSGIGLVVKPNRISQIHVDGGAGTDGADETTLDVEQSGGLAPMANIIVYDAPNTDQGFLDVFVAAVMDNKVDTLSTSWGLPEIFQTAETAAAQDQIFAQAAAQGISMFAASGDSGGYDFNDPSCKNVLTVDAPAVSPYITAAGGLTLPGIQTHKYPTPVVNVKNVRPWAWDYLADYFDTNYPQYGGYLGIAFPVGGGGGVSIYEALPSYQQKVKGIEKSRKGQSVTCDFGDGNGFVDLLDLPAHQPGRNVPDISLNADPYTGYLVYFAGGWSSGWGGTSFVAPQLNGIMSIVGQALGSRLGLINHAIYRLARNKGAYNKTGAFTDITKEDNLGFDAGPGYDPASGIGSINAADLAHALADDDGKDH